LTDAESYITEIYKLEKKNPGGDIRRCHLGKKYAKVTEKNGKIPKKIEERGRKVENANRK
jgi:hypothetical protein